MIEIVHPHASAAHARAIIFDFDGTLSLLRSGWIDVMVPLCLEQLTALKTGESPEDLHQVVEEFVWRLTGKETIYQMMALADAIRARGGQPAEPLAYKRMYLDRLWERIRTRIEALRQGQAEPDQYLVPGAHQFLQHLSERGLMLYLASGTDDENVKEEASLLGLNSFFADRIYGAQDDLKSFSKALLVQRIVSQAGFSPGELLVFGDGFVEIEEVKRVGGTAVGLATQEPECRQIDPWKRERLIAVGADFIIPNFLEAEQLSHQLFAQPSFV